MVDTERQRETRCPACIITLLNAYGAASVDADLDGQFRFVANLRLANKADPQPVKVLLLNPPSNRFRRHVLIGWPKVV